MTNSHRMRLSAVMISSTIPSAKYSCSGSPLIFAKGRHGHYAEAEPLYKRVLEIREKALGANHLDVAASLNNLAELYRTEDRYAEAEPLFKRALTIKEKALGGEDPRLVRNLNDLAGLYWHEGRYAEAEPLFRRALA